MYRYVVLHAPVAFVRERVRVFSWEMPKVFWKVLFYSIFLYQTVLLDIAGYNAFPNIAYRKVVKGTDCQIFAQIADGKDYQIQWVINRAWEFIVVDFTIAEKLGLIRIKLKAGIRSTEYVVRSYIKSI